jgi:hypothetical protein
MNFVASIGEEYKPETKELFARDENRRDLEAVLQWLEPLRPVVWIIGNNKNKMLYAGPIIDAHKCPKVVSIHLSGKYWNERPEERAEYNKEQYELFRAKIQQTHGRAPL